jgi:CNT family concentrative nucleoside transporter
VEVSVELTARMLMVGGVASDRADADRRVRGAIGSGLGLERFRKIIENQGGDPKVVDDYGRLPSAPDRHVVTAPRSGVLAGLDAERVGRASVALGAGRDRVADGVDPAVGIMVLAAPGARVAAGDPVLELHYRDRSRLDAAGAGRHHRWRGSPTDTIAHSQRGTLMLGPLQPVLGAVVILTIAYACSTNRRAIRWATVAWGLGLQIVFAVIVLKTTVGERVFTFLGTYITKLLGFAGVGSAFVFGALGDNAVWTKVMTGALGPDGAQSASMFAFQVLPTIIFIAALFAILYYFGVMQLVVRVFAVVMHRVMKASGAESLNVAASIFMGQTEAPLTIRPYLPEMTQSELMTVMTSGMAHISGGIMAAYVLFGVEAKHLLTAVIMTAPGTIMMAKMFVPETEVPKTMGSVRLEVERTDVNVIDAAGRGTAEGLHLALNVGAMLISFLALIALVNALLGIVHLSLGQIFGWVFAPVAWSMGVPWRDAPTIGNLLGTRMALNEFVAYSQLGPLKATLDPKSFTIATFALCGFANFSSIGMQIGGIGGLAPNRRHDLARLGLRAMLAGTLANFMTATIAGFLL